MKRKALLTSILTIAVCLTVISGSTFALFTSEKTISTTVTSANIQMNSVVDNIDYWSTLGDVLPESSATFNGDNTVTIQYMVPGDVVEFDLNLTNDNTNVTFSYRTVIEKVMDTGLFDGLVVTFAEDDENGNTTTDIFAADRFASDWTTVNAADAWDTRTVHVTIALPEDRGNEYQNKTCTIAYNLQAVQGNADVYNSNATSANIQANIDEHGGMISQFGDTIALDAALNVNANTEVILKDIVLDGTALTDGVINLARGAKLTIADGAKILAKGADAACIKVADGATATVVVDDLTALVAEDGAWLFELGTGAALTVETATALAEALPFIAANSNSTAITVVAR